MNLRMQSDVKKAVEVLKNGGIILYPTDTIWGIGCDATNDKAVQKVYKIKRREETKSMVVLVDDVSSIKNYVDEIPQLALKLIKEAKKPTTIIYDNAQNLALSLVGSDKSIAIRVTNEHFSKELCKVFGKPIVSTSANISDMQSPHFFSQISDEIISAVDYVVQYKQNDKRQSTPSAIIKIEKEQVKVIRE